MTADPREPISDFTEITGRRCAGNLLHFLYAGIAGSFVAAIPGLLLTIPTALELLEYVTPAEAARTAAAPLLIAATVTFAGMVVFGLPTTVYLARCAQETPMNYTLPALLLGGAIPFFTLLATAGGFGLAAFFAILGMFAATTASLIWANWRKRLAGWRRREQTNPPTNPFHDMTH